MRTRQREPFMLIGSLLAVCLITLIGCSGDQSSGSVNPYMSMQVIRTVPADGADDVPLEALISVTFSCQPDLNGLSEGLIEVVGVDGRMCCFGSTLTFQPSTPLEYATEYSVKIDSSLCSINGARLAGDFCLSFRTVEDPNLPDFPDPPARLADSIYTEP